MVIFCKWLLAFDK